MTDDSKSDTAIVEAWRKNASPWVAAVRSGEIASRKQATDAAILEAITARSPRSVLDVGCGEGWLARELDARGIEVTGIDVVPHLVDEAWRAGGGEFHVMSYEALAAREREFDVDVMACNFSLLGKESTEAVFAAAARMLGASGSFVVQTLHPVGASGEGPYRDGWRDGSWDGIGSGFSEAAPWYFRTFGGWTRLFAAFGFRLLDIVEPTGSASSKPLSAIFVARSG